MMASVSNSFSFSMAQDCKRFNPVFWNFRCSALDSRTIFRGNEPTQDINEIQIYGLLYSLNRAFAFVVEQLRQLEPMK